MSDFLDIDYRMGAYPTTIDDIGELDDKGFPIDDDDTLVQDLESQVGILKDMRKEGKLNILPPTYKSGNPRAIQQGTFIYGEQTRGDKTRKFSGIVMDRGNVYDKKMNVFFMGKDSEGITRGAVKPVKRKYIKQITPPKTIRKQTKPEKNKKTAPQKVSRFELKTGGTLGKARARDELKRGKPVKKGDFAQVYDFGKGAEVGGTDTLDKVYLKRNIRK
jgi:hypothetical protein